MTTFLLVRHGAHLRGSGVIAGRAQGVHLSERGRTQSRQLAEKISPFPVQALYSSPLERTQETAAAFSECFGLPIQVLDGLAEVDFGQWTGKEVAELRQLEVFASWNTFRSGTRIPGGESMLETQLRIVAELFRLRERHPNQCLVLVSHGDVIKAAVSYCLGVPLDLMLRIEISLASLSIVAIGDRGPWVLCINHTADALPIPDEIKHSAERL